MDSDINPFESKNAVRDISETLKAGGADIAAESRAAADAVRSAAADAADAARDATDQVGRHARAASLAAGVALDDAAETAADAARDAIDTQMSWLRDQYERVEEHMRAKPVTTFAVAAGAGLLVGLLLRSRRK